MSQTFSIFAHNLEKSKSEARFSDYCIGRHRSDATGGENLFCERRKVSQHPYPQQ